VQSRPSIRTLIRHRSNRLFSFRPASRWAGSGDDKPSWRDHYKPHPAAEVFNRKTAPEQLQQLAKDIDANGLKVPIQTRPVAGESHPYVIDGISRLDAIEKILGWQIVKGNGEWMGVLARVGYGKNMVEHLAGRTHEQIRNEVISLNAKRRHQTKEDLAEAVIETLKLEHSAEGKAISHSTARSVGGRGGGSQKDQFKTDAVTKAAELGVGRRTTERVLGRQPDRPKQPTKPRRLKPSVDKLTPEYVNKRWGMFLKHWPSRNDQRAVIRVLLDVLIGRYEGNKPISVASVTYADGKTEKVGNLLK
jgi:hypothetical protein